MEASLPGIRLVGYSKEWRDQVLGLWGKVFRKPGIFLAADLDRAGGPEGDRLTVALEGDRVVGTVVIGSDGYRGWIFYLAVASSHRHRGVARMLLDEAERRLAGQGCGSVSLQIRRSNLGVVGFYLRQGYRRDNTVTLSKRLGDAAGPG